MKDTSQTEAELFAGSLRRGNTSALRLGAIFGSTLVPLFWALDWLILPEHLTVTLILRLLSLVAGVSILLAIARARSWVERHVDAVSFVFTLYVAGSIAVMCWLHDGYESFYYAGLNLVIIAVGFLWAWPTHLSLLYYGMLYAFYMAPLMLGVIGIKDIPEAVGNQFFLVATIVITIFSQRHRYTLLNREFFASLDLQRAKGSLEQAYGRLQQLDKQKTEFFGNITHELRTPLTMILSLLESILADELGSFEREHKKLLKPMWRNALQLLKLINDLLELSKISDRFLRLHLDQTDLRELVTEVVRHTRPLAARKDIEVGLDIRRPPEDLHVDLDQMERVVINLLSNALKFTEPGGRVDVMLDTVEGELLLAVRDTGAGIPPDRLAMIFERFSQADATVTRRYGGTGIGLAFAREIVLMHGGRIAVESEPGEGSCFTVHLLQGSDHFDPQVIDRRQRRRDQGEQRRGEDREPREWTRQLLERKDYRFLDISVATERRVALRSDDQRKATKVLVVEDNQDVLRLINAQLSSEHSVFLGQNGLQGLELARRELPDVVVTDYMMPELDGLGLINALRSEPRTANIPIIMLTAKSRVEDRLDVREAGADIYLTKPFSPRELRASIKQLLEKRGRQASHILHESARALEVISAGLAHQIHNPLTYIKTSLFVIDEQVRKLKATLAEPELSDGDRQQAIERAEQRIHRMQQAAQRGVDRLSQVTDLVRRYAREGYPAETTPVRLDHLVRDVVGLVRPHTDSEISLDLQLGAEGCEVACIPEELQQVVRNLVQNAMDAVAGAGQVQVRTAREGQWALLVVSDDGQGIPRDDLQRVFTPFFTTKDPGQALGIGLAIALQVVSSLGGTIDVESPPEQGAMFSVRIPLIPPADGSADTPTNAP